ncbi:universal stress protein [Sulfurihydrogenibium subterraneum]|uniref:universal stress protein n=1 Tax=Sulfurihydrogenibium subterraneum TaxID=171121 RepID=UPI0004912280|nr:universal stress protein [Sulfurihydrogenibium subterraneum]
MAFKKIVVGYDGSVYANNALKKAIEVAKCSEAEIYVVGVIKPLDFGLIDYITPTELEEYEKEEILKEEKYLKEAIKIVEESGLKASYKILEGDPSEEIMTYADEVGADLIVVGHRGLGGFKRLLLGSTSSEIVKYAKQNVLVVKS